MLAHHRIDAVAGKRDRGVHRRQGRARNGLLEKKPDAAFFLLDIDTAVVGQDSVLAQTVARRLVENRMQPPAMDPDLGIPVAGIKAARFFIDELPETVEKRTLFILDAGGKERFTQPQRRQL